ncbi:hypothetical protein [Micromonospora sp. NPDC001898]|uniref:hypothetical protein n=1 Tax=Micromonospora sp. NPDC001898 TaxID=3364221 RepID=UPI00368A1CE5
MIATTRGLAAPIWRFTAYPMAAAVLATSRPGSAAASRSELRRARVRSSPALVGLLIAMKTA